MPDPEYDAGHRDGRLGEPLTAGRSQAYCDGWRMGRATRISTPRHDFRRIELGTVEDAKRLCGTLLNMVDEYATMTPRMIQISGDARELLVKLEAVIKSEPV